MRAADEVETSLLYQAHVARRAGVRHRIGPAGVILMDIGPMKKTVRAIEIKTVCRRPLKPAESERRVVAVHDIRPVERRGRRAVMIGRGRTPQQWIGNGRGGLVESVRRSSRNGLRRGDGSDDVAVRIQNVRQHCAGNICRVVVVDFRLDVHRAGSPRRSGERWRRHPSAVPGDMQRIGHDQVHIAVDAADERVVASARRLLRIPIIVQPHRYHVVTDHKVGADVIGKSGVTAQMLADQLSVDVHLRILKRRLEFQKHPLACPSRRDGKMFSIPAIASIEFIPSKIRNVERVRQSNRAPQRIVVAVGLRAGVIAQLEFPRLVEIGRHPAGDNYRNRGRRAHLR